MPGKRHHAEGNPFSRGKTKVTRRRKGSEHEKKKSRVKRRRVERRRKDLNTRLNRLNAGLPEAL